MKRLLIFLVIIVILIGIGIGYKVFFDKKEYFDGEEISWIEAKELVFECYVKTVFQTHARQVTIVLKNGIQLETIEPNLDDIINFVMSVQEKCGEIPIATE